MSSKPLSKEQYSERLRRQVERLTLRLYPEDSERRHAFTEAVVAQASRLPTIFWLKQKPIPSPFATKHITDWQPDWVDVLENPLERPTQNPLFEQGAYYPLDFSSVGMASPLLYIDRHTDTVLDVCSSPGGKALFAWRHLQPSQLICNEVIGKRHAALTENLSRSQVEATITQLDPKQLADQYAGTCDVALVDAPCSGQSLIARGLEASGAFQDHLVTMNMLRQRRILIHSATCVAPEGYLLYSTCTYSREENEKNVEWFLSKNPQFTAVDVPYLHTHRSSLSDVPCYRIEPHQGIGAGGFCALFQRTS